MPIALIVHGGATSIEPDREELYREGCLKAHSTGWSILGAGGSALDAVEAAVRQLESDPTFNAGRGGALRANGQVELDAAIMEGGELRFGAVAGLSQRPHPVSVARRLLERQGARLLGGPGAELFAWAEGLEACELADLITEHQRQKWEQQQVGAAQDTVGCVALDKDGLLVTATSTGGLVCAPPGRIGDSPLPGCGFYADNGIGACALSGDGEQISQLVLAKTIIDYLAAGIHPQEAATIAIDMFAARLKAEGGCIIIDKEGQVGWFHNSSHMACAYQTDAMEEPFVSLQATRPS
jgi:L-asparaginase / beta-aspartyl-peptidase